MVISDHLLAVLSFAAFCRFLDGIAGTDKVDETLEEFMEWSGLAVSLEEVREKASQPLAEEERAVLLSCWRKFLDLGVPVDEQTVGTAAGAEAPGKEVARHTYKFQSNHAFKAAVSLMKEKQHIDAVLGYPVHAGTPVQITTQLWTRLTEAQQGQFSEMAESIRSVFDELTKHPDAQAVKKQPGLTARAVKEYFEANKEQYSALLRIVAGAVKEHNNCVHTFRALAKPYLAPLTDTHMKSLPSDCLAKDCVPEGKPKQKEQARRKERVAYWNGLPPDAKDNGRADSVWIAMADTDQRMAFIETHKTAYRASTEMPPQAHMEATRALTEAIKAAVNTLVKAADAEGAPAQSDGEPSSAKPKSTSKKGGRSKAVTSPSVHGPDTPDVPTASQEQPHRHTQGGPGDDEGTHGGTQGVEVANLEPALAHADKLLDQTEGTPCGNAPSADKAKQRAEAVTAPQQMQVTNNASALGGNGSPAGPAQAASPGSAQPAASVAWPAKDTDVELLQALLKEILSIVHYEKMKQYRKRLEITRVLLVNCHADLSDDNNDGAALFCYISDSLKLQMTERLTAYKPIVKAWKNMRTRKSNKIRYDFVASTVEAYQKDPAYSGDWRLYKQIVWDVCDELHRQFQALKGLYFAMRAKCGIQRLDLPQKSFWLSDMRFQQVWEGLGSDGQKLFWRLYYVACKDLRGGSQHSLTKHRECFEAHYEKDVNPYTEILERLPDAIAYANKQDTRDSGLMDLQAHEEPCGLEDEALDYAETDTVHDAGNVVQAPPTETHHKGIDDTDMAAGDGDEEGIVALPVETAHKGGGMSHASGAQRLQPPTAEQPVPPQRKDGVQTRSELGSGDANGSNDSLSKAAKKQRRKEEKRAKKASNKSKSGTEGKTQPVAADQGQSVGQQAKADKKRPSGDVVPKAGAEPSKRLATAAPGSPAGTAEPEPSSKGAGKRDQAQPPLPPVDKKRKSKAQRSPSGKTEATQPATADEAKRSSKPDKSAKAKDATETQADTSGEVGKKRSAPDTARADKDKSRSEERSPKKQKRTDTQPSQPAEPSHTPATQAAGTTAQPPAAAAPPPPREVNTPNPKKSAAAAAVACEPQVTGAAAGGSAAAPKPAAKAAAQPAAPAPAQAAPAGKLQRSERTSAVKAGSEPAQASAKTAVTARPPQQAGPSHQATQAKHQVQVSDGSDADDESDSESEGPPAAAAGAGGRGAGVRTPSAAGTSGAALPASKTAAASAHKRQAATGRKAADSSSSSEEDSSSDEDDGADGGRPASAPAAQAAGKAAAKGAGQVRLDKDKGESSNEDETSSGDEEGEGEGDSSEDDSSESESHSEKGDGASAGKRKGQHTAAQHAAVVAAVSAAPNTAAPVPPAAAGRAQVAVERPAASGSSSSSESESDSESAPATKPAAKGTARAVQAPAHAAKPAAEGAGTATAPVNGGASGPAVAGVKQKGSAPAASPAVLAKAATKAAGVAAGQQHGAEVTSGATPGRAGKAAMPAKAPAKAAAAGPLAEGSGDRTGGAAGSQAPSAAGRSRQAVAGCIARVVSDAFSDDEGSGSGSGEDEDSSDEGEAAGRAVQAPAKLGAAAAGSSPPAAKQAASTAAGGSAEAGPSKGKGVIGSPSERGSGNEDGQVEGRKGKSEEGGGDRKVKKSSTAAMQAAAASTPAHFAAHAGDPAQAAPPRSQPAAGSQPARPHASADSDSSRSSDESSSSESSSDSDSSSESDSSSSESESSSGSDSDTTSSESQGDEEGQDKEDSEQWSLLKKRLFPKEPISEVQSKER